MAKKKELTPVEALRALADGKTLVWGRSGKTMRLEGTFLEDMDGDCISLDGWSVCEKNPHIEGTILWAAHEYKHGRSVEVKDQYDEISTYRPTKDSEWDHLAFYGWEITSKDWYLIEDGDDEEDEEDF